MNELILDAPTCNNIVDFMGTRGLSYRTVKEYSRILKILNVDYRNLNQDLVMKFLKKNKAPAAMALLRLINDFCLFSNIQFSVMLPKQKKKPRKIPPILTIDEIKIIIESAPHPYDLLIRCIFNMGAGLRISEAIKLSWSHIDWANWLQNKDSFGRALIKNAKGEKDRVVNIPPKLMMDLYSYAKKKNLVNEYGVPSGSMIFQFGSKLFKPDLFSNNLELWKNEYVKYAYDWFNYNVIVKHCEKALGKKIKIHSLRSSRATYLYEVEGVPIEKIQILLGHSDIQTTLIYTRISNKNALDSVSGVKEI